MERKQKIIIRFIVVFVGVLACFSAVVVQIIKIQTTERKQWLELARYQEPKEDIILPERGNIYDCEGRLLAGSMPKYVLAMDMRTQALRKNNGELFYANLDSISIGLSTIFKDHSSEDYKAMLSMAFRSQRRYYKLQPRLVNYAQMKAVKSLPLFREGPYKSGLTAEERYQRVKPFGTLASRSIGSVDSESGKGKTGLESSFDKELSGIPGVCERMRIQGRNESVIITPAVHGMDVVTTIDANLQDLVESLLRQRLEITQGTWGCCILMETKTGEIKALSNLDRLESGDYIDIGQHALTHMEPGSTFKTISLMAALENDVVDFKKDSFEVYRAGWKYEDAIIRDAHAMDSTLCVRDAMAASSNIALAKMITNGFKHKPEKFVEALLDLGIGDSIPSDIKGASNPLIVVPDAKVTMAKMAYGYSVELSPLNLVTIYNAFANDGKMVAPMLVKEIRKDGKTEQSFQTHVLKHHICSDKTLSAIKECLHAVVWTDYLGTAARNKYNNRKAQSDIVHIAGKTGTAQIMEGGYGQTRHRMSFVGYFPEENPQYTCICIIHHPKNSGAYDAGIDCGWVVRKIAERTMAYTGTKKTSEAKLPYDSIAKPLIKNGQQKRTYDAAREVGLKPKKSDSTWVKTDENMQPLSLKISKGQVPNVVGMGARDAIYAIEQTGMLAHVQGRGRVVRQSIAPGSAIVKNGTIYLELR